MMRTLFHLFPMAQKVYLTHEKSKVKFLSPTVSGYLNCLDDRLCKVCNYDKSRSYFNSPCGIPCGNYCGVSCW